MVPEIEATIASGLYAITPLRSIFQNVWIERIDPPEAV